MRGSGIYSDAPRCSYKYRGCLSQTSRFICCDSVFSRCAFGVDRLPLAAVCYADATLSELFWDDSLAVLVAARDWFSAPVSLSV